MKNELLEKAYKSYITEIKNDDPILNNNGSKCPWWNASCQLGNTGKWCTLSKECLSYC